jgi:hypothetical protein
MLNPSCLGARGAVEAVSIVHDDATWRKSNRICPSMKTE